MLCSRYFVMRLSRKARRQAALPKKKQSVQKDKALLEQAYALHRQGSTAEAAEVYESFLARHPRHGEALGNFALLHHSQGRVARAVALYEQAVRISPRLHHLYYHLGNGLRQLGRPRQAIVAYERALAHGKADNKIQLPLALARIEAGQRSRARTSLEEIVQRQPADGEARYQLGLLLFEEKEYEAARAAFDQVLAVQPDYVDACFNLALCYKALQQPAQALAILGEASRLACRDADILYNIGVLHREQGNVAAAEQAFLQALEIDADNGVCLTDLAILYHGEDRLEEAVAMYERALECGYQPDSARHMLAALRGETTGAAPLEHVRHLFDNYADTFDASLVDDLHYRVPEQLAECFRQRRGEAVPAAVGLDLGCGTGLAGHAFQGMVRRFIGVDLSERMLLQAAARGVYDEVHCADIIAFMQEDAALYDLILATDVFVYLGALHDFFRQVETLLAPGGSFLFSVESCRRGYCLRQSGRYAHAPDYIAGLLARHGLAVLHRQATGIRKERGEWIPGEIYMVRRHSGA